MFLTSLLQYWHSLCFVLGIKAVPAARTGGDGRGGCSALPHFMSGLRLLCPALLATPIKQHSKKWIHKLAVVRVWTVAESWHEFTEVQRCLCLTGKVLVL